jgi:flagellar biosynthesis chaperone FliJ
MSALGFRKSLYLLALISGFGLLLATAVGLWQARNAAGAAARIYEERTAPTVELMKAVDALHRARQTILIALSEEREELAQAHLGKLAEKTGSATHQIRSLLENVRQTASTASEQMASSHERIQTGTLRLSEVSENIGEIERQLAAIASAAAENSTAVITVVGEAGSVSQAADVLHQRVGRFSL